MSRWHLAIGLWRATDCGTRWAEWRVPGQQKHWTQDASWGILARRGAARSGQHPSGIRPQWSARANWRSSLATAF